MKTYPQLVGNGKSFYLSNFFTTEKVFKRDYTFRLTFNTEYEHVVKDH